MTGGPTEGPGASLPLSTRKVVVRLDEVPSSWKRAEPVLSWAVRGSGPVYPRQTKPHKVVRVTKRLPDSARASQTRIARAAWLAMRGQGGRRFGVCKIHIVAVFPRPQRLDKSDPGRHWHCVTPDVDNVAKNVLDALQRDAMGGKPRTKPKAGWPGVIPDDKLVVSLLVEKFYAAMNEAPSLTITIEDVR